MKNRKEQAILRGNWIFKNISLLILNFKNKSNFIKFVKMFEFLFIYFWSNEKFKVSKLEMWNSNYFGKKMFNIEAILNLIVKKKKTKDQKALSFYFCFFFLKNRVNNSKVTTSLLLFRMAQFVATISLAFQENTTLCVIKFLDFFVELQNSPVFSSQLLL